MPCYQSSVNLKKSRLCDQICPKRHEWQKFAKNKHSNRDKLIRMFPCTKLGELQFLGQNSPPPPPQKKALYGGVIGQTQPENSLF